MEVSTDPQAKGYVAGDRYARADEDDAQTPEGDTRGDAAGILMKKYDAQAKKTRVHMAQVAGAGAAVQHGDGLRRGEQIPEGLYAHGEYPFVLYKYRDAWREPFGTGLIYDYLTHRRQSTDTPNTSTTMRGNQAYSGTSSEGGAA